jgi:signal transduction histidine kinase
LQFKSKSQVKNFGKSFAGPAATSPLIAIFILGFLSFGTAFNEKPDRPLPTQAMREIAYESLILSFAIFVSFGLFIRLVAKKPSLIRNGLVVILFFGTEALRAVFVGYAMKNLDLSSEINWPYRIVAGGLTGLTIFGLTSFIVNNNQIYKKSLHEANEVQARLKTALSVTESDLAQIKNEILSKIKSAIDVALQNTLKSDSTVQRQSKDVVHELLRVSDEVVRPLSYELFSNEYQISEQIGQFKNKKISSKRIFQLAVLNPYHPLLIVGIAFGLMAGNALFDSVNKADGLLGLAAMMVVIFITIWPFSKFLNPLLINLSNLFKLVLATFVFASIQYVILSLEIITESLRISPTPAVHFYIGAIAIILGWMIAIVVALQTARAEVLNSFTVDNEKLAWVNARLGAKLWAERRHLAAVVHRDVQGKLVSAALKFQNELSNGKSEKHARDELLQTLANLTDDLIAKPEAISPSDSIAKLNYLWGDIFNIVLSISDECNERVINDPICENALNDLFIEFATNSVKHGKASKSEIEIMQLNSQAIKVLMRNNGTPLLTEITPGLGSEMARSQTLSLKLRNLPTGGVEFEAILPVA